MPELQPITIEWNVKSSEVDRIKNELVQNRPVLLNIVDIPFRTEVKDELISDDTNEDLKDIYKLRNKFHAYLNDEKLKSKPLMSKNYPQYTTLTDQDTYCNLTWLGFCKALDATPSVHYPYTMVGGVSKTRNPQKTRIVNGKEERYTPFGPETTQAHWHAPPVMNLALYGSCKKMYKLVPWQHMTKAQKTSNTSNIEASQYLQDQVYTATIGMHEAANCILLPPKMLHEITTVGLDEMKNGKSIFEGESMDRQFYLGFGTYFALNYDDYMQDVKTKLSNVNMEHHWYAQFGSQKNAQESLNKYFNVVDQQIRAGMCSSLKQRLAKLTIQAVDTPKFPELTANCTPTALASTSSSNAGPSGSSKEKCTNFSGKRLPEREDVVKALKCLKVSNVDINKLLGQESSTRKWNFTFSFIEANRIPEINDSCAPESTMVMKNNFIFRSPDQIMFKILKRLLFDFLVLKLDQPKGYMEKEYSGFALLDTTRFEIEESIPGTIVIKLSEFLGKKEHFTFNEVFDTIRSRLAIFGKKSTTQGQGAGKPLSLHKELQERWKQQNGDSSDNSDDDSGEDEEDDDNDDGNDGGDGEKDSERSDSEKRDVMLVEAKDTQTVVPPVVPVSSVPASASETMSEKAKGKQPVQQASTTESAQPVGQSSGSTSVPEDPGILVKNSTSSLNCFWLHDKKINVPFKVSFEFKFADKCGPNSKLHFLYVDNKSCSDETSKGITFEFACAGSNARIRNWIRDDLTEDSLHLLSRSDDTSKKAKLKDWNTAEISVDVDSLSYKLNESTLADIESDDILLNGFLGILSQKCSFYVKNFKVEDMDMGLELSPELAQEALQELEDELEDELDAPPPSSSKKTKTPSFPTSGLSDRQKEIAKKAASSSGSGSASSVPAASSSKPSTDKKRKKEDSTPSSDTPCNPFSKRKNKTNKLQHDDDSGVKFSDFADLPRTAKVGKWFKDNDCLCLNFNLTKSKEFVRCKKCVRICPVDLIHKSGYCIPNCCKGIEDNVLFCNKCNRQMHATCARFKDGRQLAHFQNVFYQSDKDDAYCENCIRSI